MALLKYSSDFLTPARCLFWTTHNTCQHLSDTSHLRKPSLLSLSCLHNLGGRHLHRLIITMKSEWKKALQRWHWYQALRNKGKYQWVVKGALGARPLEVFHCNCFLLGQISPLFFFPCVCVCDVFACMYMCVHMYGCTCEGGMVCIHFVCSCM